MGFRKLPVTYLRIRKLADESNPEQLRTVLRGAGLEETNQYRKCSYHSWKICA